MKKQASKGKEITVMGIVRDFDDEDDVLQVKIVTDDDEYLVEQDKVGKRLLHLISERVEAQGMLTTDKEGQHHLKVSTYDVIEEELEDYEDEDYEDDGI